MSATLKMIAATLVAAMLGLCAPAQAQTDRIRPQPEEKRWTALLQAAGQSALEPGDRAYRSTRWSPYGAGFIEVLEKADGKAWTRDDQAVSAVPLQPGDLEVFHALLAPLKLTADNGGIACLDDCRMLFFDVQDEHGYLQTIVEDPALWGAVNELEQISGARRQAGLFRPRPWWTLASERSALPGRDWITDRGLAELAAPEASPRTGRAYRLIRFPEGTAPVVTTVELGYDPEYDDCEKARLDPRTMGGILGCDTESPNRIVVQSSGQRHSFPITALAMWEPFEQTLANGGFSITPAEDADCPSPLAGLAPWVFEALIDGRYRYVRSNGCDDRSLGQALTEIDGMAAGRRPRG